MSSDIIHRRPLAFDLPQNRGTVFETVERIDPVALIYGGGKLYVGEFQSSRHLLKELWRIGRKKIQVRGMISTVGALDRSSLRALNCYLHHCYSKQSAKAIRSGRTHRHAWYALQEAAKLRWVA